MSDTFRCDRIMRLLDELRYEVTRGIMEQEIDETLTCQFIIPASTQLPGGVVLFDLRCRPVHAHSIVGRERDAIVGLRAVK